MRAKDGYGSQKGQPTLGLLSHSAHMHDFDMRLTAGVGGSGGEGMPRLTDSKESAFPTLIYSSNGRYSQWARTIQTFYLPKDGKVVLLTIQESKLCHFTLERTSRGPITIKNLQKG